MVSINFASSLHLMISQTEEISYKMCETGNIRLDMVLACKNLEFATIDNWYNTGKNGKVLFSTFFGQCKYCWLYLFMNFCVKFKFVNV